MSARTIVVGAGLSGLACAFDLARAGRDVLVVDAAARAGGVVSTRAIDGFLFEEGPSTVQAKALNFRGLCADLDLTERLIASNERAHTRWLWFRGRLVALPSSLLTGVSTPLLSLRAKWRIASEPWRRFVPPDDGALEPTLEAFLVERLGVEPTRILAGSFVRGVYAAEIGELGARSAFPRMWNACVQHGGIVRAALEGRRAARTMVAGPDVAPTRLLSFPRGFQELVDALVRELGPRLRFGVEATTIERESDLFTLVTRASERISARSIVLALPAPQVARLLASATRGRIDVTALANIRHAQVDVVHLGFDAATIARFPRGFGFLVPPDARDRGSTAPRCLGTIFTSNVFDGRAPLNGKSCASFYAGRDVEGLDDAQLARLAAEDLALAGRFAHVPRPSVIHVRRWNDVIPRYEPGHAERVRTLLSATTSSLSGVHLAGSWVAGISVDDVIARGRAVARTLLAEVPA